MSEAAKLPRSKGRLYWTEAVCRRVSPGSSASGFLSRPYEYCTAQFLFGATVTRSEREFQGLNSRLYRCSSGSRPLKSEPSNLSQRYVKPVVKTPKEMCVESS